MSPATILTGTFDEAIATLLIADLMGTIEASGSAAGDTAVGSLQLTAGDALTDLFVDDSLVLGGRQTASFALSELSGMEDGDDLFTLMGSAAFTGSSQVIPSPGSASLLGLAGLVALRRRR
jgi:MYXO-CTERM domain-containing protein